MVAIVGGANLGVSLTSLSVLGERGVGGSAQTGRNGEQAYVNAANGNLVLSDLDDRLAGHGVGVRSLRTYNSQGLLSDDNADNWGLGLARKVYGLSGTLNAAGSTVQRQDEDGAVATYTWNAGTARYESLAGGGAVDTLSLAGARWKWTEGDTGLVEQYDSNNGGRLDSIADPSGNTLTFAFNAQGLLASVATNSGETTYYDYSGNQLTQIRTVAQGSSTWTRVRYGYDTSNRLQTVTVDLSPENNNVSDGKTYVTTYGYDGASKRVNSVTQSDGSSLSIAYIQLSANDVRVQKVTDALGNATSFAYDTANRRTSVTDALGLVTRYDYDTQGQLVQITAPAVNGVSQISSFTYNANGDLIRAVDPAGRTVDMTYDASGNQTQQKDSLYNAALDNSRAWLPASLSPEETSLTTGVAYHRVFGEDRTAIWFGLAPYATSKVGETYNMLDKFRVDLMDRADAGIIRQGFSEGNRAIFESMFTAEQFYQAGGTEAIRAMVNLDSKSFGAGWTPKNAEYANSLVESFELRDQAKTAFVAGQSGKGEMLLSQSLQASADFEQRVVLQQYYDKSYTATTLMGNAETRTLRQAIQGAADLGPRTIAEYVAERLSTVTINGQSLSFTGRDVGDVSQRMPFVYSLAGNLMNTYSGDGNWLSGSQRIYQDQFNVLQRTYGADAMFSVRRRLGF